MSKLIRLIEGLLLPAIAAASLLVSLADLFGLFHLIPASNVPMLTLLLVSLALNALVFLQRRSTEMYEQIQRLLSRSALEQLSNDALEEIDSDLRRVLKDDFFLDMVESLRAAIKEGKVQVNDMARLRYYYIRTLLCYPRSTFLATSSPAASSLWKDHAIEKATVEFIRNGGKMKHILLVKSIQELDAPATQAIIAQQQKMGVQVHIVISLTTPVDLRKNFIVEARGKIAWEINVDDDGHMGASTVTANKLLAASYCRIFEKLRESEIHATVPLNSENAQKDFARTTSQPFEQRRIRQRRHASTISSHRLPHNGEERLYTEDS